MCKEGCCNFCTPKKTKRERQEEFTSQAEKEAQQKEWGEEEEDGEVSEKEGEDEEYLVAGLMRVEEQLDDLSL